jgi:hypothetical protein
MSEEKLVFAQNYIDGKFEDCHDYLDSFNPVRHLILYKFEIVILRLLPTANLFLRRYIIKKPRIVLKDSEIIEGLCNLIRMEIELL